MQLVTLSIYSVNRVDITFMPGLKIMALNTWGMPASLGSYDKTDRMKAIGEHIGKAEHDIYLLEELWMRGDHSTIKSKIPEGYTKLNQIDRNVIL